MSGSTLRLIIAGILLVHGIGHIMGVLPVLGVGRNVETWSLRTGLMSRLVGETAGQWIGVILFLLAFVGFIGAGLALLNFLVPYSAWRTLAVGSSIISLIAIALYWNAFVTLLNKGGAIIVDVATLVGILIMQWPSDAELGM